MGAHAPLHNVQHTTPQRSCRMPLTPTLLAGGHRTRAQAIAVAPTTSPTSPSDDLAADLGPSESIFAVQASTESDRRQFVNGLLTLVSASGSGAGSGRSLGKAGFGPWPPRWTSAARSRPPAHSAAAPVSNDAHRRRWPWLIELFCADRQGVRCNRPCVQRVLAVPASRLATELGTVHRSGCADGAVSAIGARSIPPGQ